MPFTCEITFTGLFLFVPDDRVSTDKKLHVLLPPTAVLGAGHEHYAELFYEGEYAVPKEMTKQTISFDKGVIGLALPTANMRPPLPTLVDAGKLADNSTIHPDQVSGAKLDPSLHGRLTLPAPHAATLGPTALWSVDQYGPVYLSHQVKCVWLDLAGSRMEITIDVAGTVQTREVQPDEQDFLHLEFRHLPKADHIVKKGEPAHHFKAYYEVFRSEKKGGSPILRQDPKAFIAPPSASTFTCMGATASLG